MSQHPDTDGESLTPRPTRWFSHQPNVPGRGIVASYTLRFWAIVVALGVSTGVAGSLLMEILKIVEHASWNYHSGTYLAAARAAPAWRHLVILAGAAVPLWLGVAVLRRLPSSGGGEVSQTIWLNQGRTSFLPSIVRGLISIVTVGMGVSLGREAAPQLAGAATASRLAGWASLPPWQRRLLVACGAGAGMAAVYNVPLGGTLFALEVLIGTLSLPLVLPALATSAIATSVAWIALGTHPTYSVPAYGAHASQLAWATLMGPVIGVAAVVWVRTIARVNALHPRRWRRFVAPFAVFLALGGLSIPYPQLLGNGSDIVQSASLGRLSVGLLIILLGLKPLATAACLGSGSPGGLFTPTLTLGILLADITGTLWTHLWPGAPSGSYALIGGGAFIAAAMQAPVSAIVLVLELTRHTDSLIAPTLLTVLEATIIARILGAPSIYSARIETGRNRTPVPADAAEGPRAAAARLESAVGRPIARSNPTNADPPPMDEQRLSVGGRTGAVPLGYSDAAVAEYHQRADFASGRERLPGQARARRL